MCACGVQHPTRFYGNKPQHVLITRGAPLHCILLLHLHLATVGILLANAQPQLSNGSLLLSPCEPPIFSEQTDTTLSVPTVTQDCGILMPVDSLRPSRSSTGAMTFREAIRIGSWDLFPSASHRPVVLHVNNPWGRTLKQVCRSSKLRGAPLTAIPSGV
jgi:hypothetical protein